MNMQIDLDQIRVTSPCDARWEDMVGDERARFCGQCRKHVFNLSAMTRPEITSLIQKTEGKFCGRFYQRHDGRMLTADCPTGRRRRRNRLVRWAGAVLATALMLLGIRNTVRAQSRNAAGAGSGRASRLMGEVSVATVRMGDIALPAATATNCPAPNHPPAIMGKIAPPAQTNRSVQPIHPR